MRGHMWRGFPRLHEASGPSRLPANYLLSWCDVGVDVLEDRLEHGIVAHAQVLDLDLTTLGPVVRHLRGVCRHKHREASQAGEEQGSRKQSPGLLLCCRAATNKSSKTVWRRSKHHLQHPYMLVITEAAQVPAQVPALLTDI